MSFLDNLENNLKALENAEERDPGARKRAEEARAAERNAAEAIAPYAEQIRRSKFTDQLLGALMTLGHERKLVVRPTFLDQKLRLETGAKRLELVPTPQGVEAVYYVDGNETAREKANLEGDAVAFAKEWLEA